jgi:TonB family protein
LREFLSELRAVAKSGDQAKVDSMIKQTEIPEYRNWFCSVYIPGSGLSWAIPYGNNLAQSEQSFKTLWLKLAQDEGEIRVRKLVDKPGGNRDMEWGMIHNSRTPLDIYHASWKSSTRSPDEWIGYFIYIDGMFRLENTGRRVSVGAGESTQDRAQGSSSETGRSRGEHVYRVSGDVKPPRAVSSPQPNYPQKARQNHVEGQVVILLTVDSDGRPRDLEVKQGISAELDQAAMDAAEKWRFKPATLQGKPVSVRIAIEFNFHP